MRNLLLFSALCLGVSVAGRADTTFYLINNTYGTLSPDESTIAVNGSAVGSFSIDTVGGTVDAVNVTVTEGGSQYIFTGAPYSQGSYPQAPYVSSEYSTQSYDAAGDFLEFYLPVATLTGYLGGNLCTFSQPQCIDPTDPSGMTSDLGYLALFDPSGNETDYAAASGSLASTPEPSSLVLMGTGLLATVGAARRRVFSRGA